MEQEPVVTAEQENNQPIEVDPLIKIRQSLESLTQQRDGSDNRSLARVGLKEFGGATGVYDNSSWWEKSKYKLASLWGEKSRNHQINNMAEKLVERELTKLEKGDGRRLVLAKYSLKTNQANLDLADELASLDPSASNQVQEKLNKERDGLLTSQDTLETNLTKALDQHPAKQGFEKAHQLLDGYREIASRIAGRQVEISDQIKKFERDCYMVFGRVPSGNSSNIQKALAARKMATLRSQQKEIRRVDKEIQKNIRQLTEDEAKLARTVRRIDCIGKTSEESLAAGYDAGKDKPVDQADNNAGQSRNEGTERVAKSKGGRSGGVDIESMDGQAKLELLLSSQWPLSSWSGALTSWVDAGLSKSELDDFFSQRSPDTLLSKTIMIGQDVLDLLVDFYSQNKGFDIQQARQKATEVFINGLY